MSRQAASAIRTIIRDADRHGVTLTKSLRESLTRALTTAELAREDRPAPALPPLLVDALSAGRDPLTDKAVREAAVSYVIATAVPAGVVREVAETRAAATLSEHLPDLLAAYAPRWAELGRGLADAHAVLSRAGVADLGDGNRSVRAGTEAARAHADALEAVARLDAIRNALVLVRAATGSTQTGTRVAEVVALADTGDTPADALYRAGQGRKVTPWAMVDAGWTLDLATSDEQLAERIAHAQAMQDQADAAAERERRAAIRAHVGV